jgi:hypothetical protein
LSRVRSHRIASASAEFGLLRIPNKGHVASRNSTRGKFLLCFTRRERCQTRTLAAGNLQNLTLGCSRMFKS